MIDLEGSPVLKIWYTEMHVQYLMDLLQYASKKAMYTAQELLCMLHVLLCQSTELQ